HRGQRRLGVLRQVQIVEAQKETSQHKLIPLANVSTDPAEAQKLVQSGDLLSARQSLNAILLSSNPTDSQTADLKKQIHELNKTIIFSTKRFANDPFGGSYAVQNGDALQKIAKSHAVTWELLGRMNDISDPRKLRAGRAIKVINGPFHAVVSKSRFSMEIWLGEPMSSDSMFVGTFYVGLGKEGSTPTGTWIVSPGGKMKNPKFWGAGDLPPMEADDPQNPLGEFWLALTGIDGDAEGREGFGIHGTIDPTTIGKNASLGCIRLAKDDIAMIYELLVDGKSKVIVKE
ncbi:MAG TPA: L,D-transpeptidase family protein, partial [Tepidisphaeraceae bacterium]|nr:L,D-transpeptidase family protein [Tepidisphaeraceae bacterium]